MPTKPKKRGRKPGVKVGPYKKKPKLGSQIRIRLPKDFKIIDRPLSIDQPNYSPTPVLTLCGQLEDSILLLENRISNVIAKINSLM